MRNVVSISFGKDSLAMLLIMLKRGMRIDEAVFYDTEVEFDCIYTIRDKVKVLLGRHGIPFTQLRPNRCFLYSMLEKPIHKQGTERIHRIGYGWCGGPCRWGTSAKIQSIDRHCRGSNIHIAIAADERERIKQRSPYKLYPLVDWGMTEADCLEYCYNEGYRWTEDGVELYDILSRVSCWCCRNKNLDELRNIYHFLPRYWEKLRDLQSKIHEPMKGPGKSVFDLERRFEQEKRRAA